MSSKPTRRARSGRPAGRMFFRVGVAGLAALIGCTALTACAGSSSSTSATAGCVKQQVTMNTAGAVQAGTCPTNTVIAIDRTAFGQGGQVGTEVASRVLAAGSATLTNGGLLSVVLYGRDADRSVTVYQNTLPTGSQENQFSRGEQEQQIEAAIRSAVIDAFANPQQLTPQLRASLALLDGRGSDVGRSLRNAIHLAARGGNASAVVDLTDGYNNTAEFSLANAIGHESVGAIAKRLATLAGLGSDPHIDLIAIPTLGQVPAQYQRNQQPWETDRLVEAWQTACGLLNPGNCAIPSAA